MLIDKFTMLSELSITAVFTDGNTLELFIPFINPPPLLLYFFFCNNLSIIFYIYLYLDLNWYMFYDLCTGFVMLSAVCISSDPFYTLVCIILAHLSRKLLWTFLINVWPSHFCSPTCILSFHNFMPPSLKIRNYCFWSIYIMCLIIVKVIFATSTHICHIYTSGERDFTSPEPLG